jgi:hypothetical protein
MRAASKRKETTAQKSPSFMLSELFASVPCLAIIVPTSATSVERTLKDGLLSHGMISKVRSR